MELVDQAFSECCHEGLIKQDILNMMEQFGLIVKFATSPADVQYFVPAQLRSPPGRLGEKKPSPSDACPLYLHFPQGFVPHGLFSQLVSRCTRWCSEIGLKQPPNMFDRASRFLIKKQFIHQLILVCKKRFIKVVFMKQTKPDGEVSLAEIEAEEEEVASLVRTFLEETMNNFSRELPWLSNLKCELCVACPYCPDDTCPNHGQVSCTHEDCLCLLEILEGGQLSNCPNNFDDEEPTLPTLKKWFAIKGGHLCGKKIQGQWQIQGEGRGGGGCPDLPPCQT